MSEKERTPGKWKAYMSIVHGKEESWFIGAKMENIAACGSKSCAQDPEVNARFIVTACNAHDELVEALEFIAANSCYCLPYPKNVGTPICQTCTASAALAKAKGETDGN